MAKIKEFKTKQQIETIENLKKYIDNAKYNITLWSNHAGFNWENTIWESHDKNIRFLSLNSRSFNHKSVNNLSDYSMSEHFIDFAKAFIRTTQNKKITKTISFTLITLQLLEQAILKTGVVACPTNISQKHFEIACDLIVSENLLSRAQAIGNILEKIAEVLYDHGITNSNVRHWKHPFQGMDFLKNTKNKSENKKNKLPNQDALLAAAEIFARGYTEKQDDADIYISCVICLLLCAPIRIGELLWFRKNVLTSDYDSEKKEQFYLSYWVSKVGKSVKKPIPETMAPLAKEAVRRLLSITEEGRQIALHYESSDEKFYRHATCPKINDDEPLTTTQLSEALGIDHPSNLSSFLFNITGSHSIKGWTLNKLAKVLALENKKNIPLFPYQIHYQSNNKSMPPKMSDSLFCFKKNQLSSFKTSPVLLTKLNNDYFRSRIRSDHSDTNFFIKNGYKKYKIRSHQLRHFLNTLAQEAGLDTVFITEWSSRASSAQSRVYMHSDPYVAVKSFSVLTFNETNSNDIQPITEDEYSLKDKGPIIVTSYGICSHDYTLTPCSKHVDCLNCSELIMCKGHKKSIEAIIKERDRILENFTEVDRLVNSGDKAPTRWYVHHKETLSRINEIIEILTNSEIKDGTPILLLGNDFSHQSRITANKTKITNTEIDNSKIMNGLYNAELLECFNILKQEDKDV